MAANIAEFLAVDATEPDHFVTRFDAERMGNPFVAYGGCSIGAAIQSAYQTVVDGHILYSVLGTYTAPAQADCKLFCSVRRLRSTRNFSTRQVEVTQKLDDGSTRLCMVVLADFHAKEPASHLDYSAPPSKAFSPPEECRSPVEIGEDLVRRGTLSQDVFDGYRATFGLQIRFFESRFPREGTWGHNLTGAARGVETGQEDLPIWDKTSADWFKSKQPIPPARPSDHFAALGFVLDGALPFVPLIHNGQYITDAAACASLEFALRFFVTEVDANQWFLREVKTCAGGDGRSYSEARVWDRSGKMVASMTQQSILRPKKKPASL
ncbi:hypothetical protein VTK73DRAFT_8912 [Phialemonium thermophilum]|uniref:Acyl-CoA thioesterase II n=1 Tax=Phialemonium thermophilum TaxID=223376 RepID=A0ABR3W5S7_9PEZI